MAAVVLDMVDVHQEHVAPCMVTVVTVFLGVGQVANPHLANVTLNHVQLPQPE